MTGLQCHGACATVEGVGTLAGAVVAAGGVAVIAVLALRAMGEWSTGPGRRPDVWPPPEDPDPQGRE